MTTNEQTAPQNIADMPAADEIPEGDEGLASLILEIRAAIEKARQQAHPTAEE